MAALLAIPASIVGVIYFLGVVTSLKFAWMTPLAPYFYSCVAFSLLMWVVWFVLDYRTVRTAAFAKPADRSVDVEALVHAEKKERISELERFVKQHIADVQRMEKSIRDLAPAEKSLRQRTIDLANDLLRLVSQLGPPPPHALSSRGTEAEQRQTFNNHFHWQTNRYYNYMAYFKDRILQIDYELAAHGVMTTLDVTDINPQPGGEVDLNKIANALASVANKVD